MALLECQQEVDNKSKFASFLNQGRCFLEESGTHLFQLQVFRKYLLKITSQEMTSWGCYPVLLSSHLSFQRKCNLLEESFHYCSTLGAGDPRRWTTCCSSRDDVDIITKSSSLSLNSIHSCPTWVVTELDQLHLMRVRGEKLRGIWVWGCTGRIVLCCCCSIVAQSCQTCDHMDCSLRVTLCMEFSRQEYWSGLPFPSPGDL